MAAALLVRLILATQPIAHHPDEIWQYLEPAYGLVTGRWIVTWEFHAGIRGWLIPMMLAPAVALGQALAPATQLHIWLVRLMLSVLSLGVVGACYQLGARVTHRHGLIAAWVAAIWVEIVFFAARSSGEAIAVSLVMPAIALLYRLRDRPDFRHALAAGGLLGLGAIARFQYLPAIALIALASAWGANRLRLPLLLGTALALGVGGLADALAGQTPLLWIYTNYTINIGQGRSAGFGTLAPGWYVTRIIATWGWCSLLLIPALLIGARRLPMIAAAALVIIGGHTAVPHKEYRFVLLAVVLLVVLAAVGSVDAAQWLEQRHPRYRQFTIPLLGGLWFALSLTVAVSKPFSTYWDGNRGTITALVDAGRRPDICGLAILREPTYPRAAYAFFNRDVPILLFDGPVAGAAAAANRQRFNVIIAPRLEAGNVPGDYRLDHCLLPRQPLAKQLNCTYLRPGGCRDGAGDFDYNRVLSRLGR